MIYAACNCLKEMSLDAPPAESHAPKKAAFYTLETITEIMPKGGVCCSSSTPSYLEVKEFADIESRASRPDAIPLARMLHWHEIYNMLPTEQRNYQLQCNALFFFFL